MTRQAAKKMELDNQAAIEEAKLDTKRKMQDKELAFKRKEHTRDIAYGLIPKVSFKAGGKNDPAWYKNYIKDLSSFVNLTTFDRVGATTFGPLYCYGASGNIIFNVPGIIAIPWIPTVGSEPLDMTNGTIPAGTFPINVGLGRMMQKVLELNSRSSVPYDKEDLGLNMFCTSDIASRIIELGRAIQVYNTYHVDNAYFAEYLLTALGFSFNDMTDNIAEYRKTYIRLATLFNKSIVAPNFATLYARRLFLAGNVFTDSEDANYPRQLYVFKQAACFRLTAAGDAADCIEARNTTLNTVKSQIMNMINAIIENPDYSEMYNDLRFAYGKDIVQLPVEGVVDKSIILNADNLNREQIHNLKTLPIVRGQELTNLQNSLYDNFRLTTTGGELIQGCNLLTAPSGQGGVARGYIQTFVNGTAGGAFKGIITELFGNINGMSPLISGGYQLLDMHKRDVTGDDILDITRWAFTLKAMFPSSNVDCVLHIASCGTEIATKFEIYVAGRDLNYNTTQVYQLDLSTYYISESFANTYYFSLLTAFDWMPTTMFCSRDGLKYDVITYSDVHTTFKIDAGSLDQINSVCVLSELFADKPNWSRG